MKTLDLLAVAAHPDDVEISCAGTLLVAKKLGKRVGILDLTRGELSSRGTVETRQIETDIASSILQLDERINLDIPDGQIDISRDNMMKLVRVIRSTRPTILLSPPKDERHPDHEAASELVKQASFYAGLKKIETFDDSGTKHLPYRPNLVLQYMQSSSFIPSVIIDVTDVFEDRMKAVLAYSNQFGLDSNGNLITNDNDSKTFLTNNEFFKTIEARARYFGFLIGTTFGEPFFMAEPIGTKDLFSLVTKEIA